MKNKALFIALAALLSLTGCGTNKNTSSSEKESSSAVEETTAETSEEETTAESAETTEAETETATEETTESNGGDYAALTAEPIYFELVDGLSEKYVDFENRSFAFDGKVYTLGVDTLQTLIDGGIPFEESELNNKDNNVNQNRGSSRYTVRINDRVSMQLEFINTTDGPISEKECLLYQIRCYTMYVPKPEYDETNEGFNAEIVDGLNDAAHHICLSFPLDLKKDDLLEKCPDATKVDEFNNVEYKVDSTVYMGGSGYNFSFDNDTNQFKEVYINWLP